jgi:uncharacterized membrane protein
MNPEKLSHQLRTGSGLFLQRRRGIIGLSLVSIASMSLITLYQTGIIGHVPEPPLPGFDADKVDASPEAYAILATPDAALGLVSYATTLALAAMGDQDRATNAPWIPLALAAKVAVDATQAGRLTVEQWTKHRAFCLWCLVAAGATFATVPLAVPEARAALRQLR